MTSQTLQARIPGPLWAWLEEYRKEHGVTRSAVVIDALERFRGEAPLRQALDEVLQRSRPLPIKRSTLKRAAIDVLQERGPLRTRDILAELQRRGTYEFNPDAKTPEATLSAVLSTGREFERVGRGVYALAGA
jgi:HB1, ASXL, restriction endonuclease HTH domain